MATGQTLANGRIRLVVASSARKVQVKYKTKSGRKHVRTKRTSHHQVVLLLPAGSRSVFTRALGSTTLRGTKWRRVSIATAGTSAPTPNSPVTNPAPSTAIPAPSSTSPAPSPTDPASSPVLTAAELVEVAGLRVFFGHQSVGGNLLGAVPGVFARYGLAAPAVVDGVPPAAGGLGNAYVGRNGDPRSKIDAFADWVNNRGVGTGSRVAFMKLCYVDVTAQFDVDAWFTEYRTKMTALESAYPGVTFLHVTAPLTTGSPADNATRTRLNERIRSEYGATGRLFDLAAIESTRPDGSRVTGTHGDQTYEALYEGYTSDGGHLNGTGAHVAASQMLHVIATAV